MADIQHASITSDALLHEPKGAGSAAANSVYVFNGAGSGSATKIPTKLYLTVYIADISAPSSSFVVCPLAGNITKWWTTINNAITGANCGLTLEIAGVAVTNSAITVTQAGSAAGDVDTATPTAANTLTAGQAIEIVSDGASSTTCPTTATIEITLT